MHARHAVAQGTYGYPEVLCYRRDVGQWHEVSGKLGYFEMGNGFTTSGVETGGAEKRVLEAGKEIAATWPFYEDLEEVREMARAVKEVLMDNDNREGWTESQFGVVP